MIFVNQPKFKYALLAGDVLSLVLSYLLSLVLAERYALSETALGSIGGGQLSVIGVALPIFLFVFLVNNLYKRQTLRSRYRHVTVVLKCILISTAVLLPIIIVLGWQVFLAYSRFLVLYFVLLAFLGVSATRLLIVRASIYPRGRSPRRRRLLVVGGGTAATKVAAGISQDTTSAFEIAGFVDDYRPKGEFVCDGQRNLGKLDELERILARLSPDEILIAIDNAPYSRLVHVVEQCLASGRVVRVYSDRLEVLAARLGAEEYAEGLPVIMLSQVQPTPAGRSMRRLVDIVLSLSALALLSPLLLLVVLGIKLSSPGPVTFRQTRIGLGGEPFDFYKFRSMHVGSTDTNHQEFVTSFIKGAADGRTDDMKMRVFKIKDDPRIFPFGRFIRKTSLDEFPQLINVLKGDMGLVGSRPCLPYEWEVYDEWHKARLSVLPGCTGLWQVLGRSTVTFEDMVIMDLYYISNYSLFEDVRILYRTIPAIFFGRGGL